MPWIKNLLARGSRNLRYPQDKPEEMVFGVQDTNTICYSHHVFLNVKRCMNYYDSQ